MLDIKKISDFISVLRSKGHGYDSNKIFTYIQSIENIDFTYQLSAFKLFNNYFYISVPLNSFTILAVGEAKTDRQTSTGYSKLERIFNQTDIEIKEIPLYVGGIKFPIQSKENIWDDFQDEKWFIPKVTLYRKYNKNYLVINITYTEINSSTFIEEIQSFLSPYKAEENRVRQPLGNIGTVEEGFYENWDYIINSALGRIKKNEFKKVVLSRRKVVNLNSTQNISEIIKTLESNYPECYIFSYKEYNSIFFGATPERLAKIEGGIIETDALAGSIKRGFTEEEDSVLSNKLLNDKKELEEHKAVLDFLLDKLTVISENIEQNKLPQIKKLSNIQHLWIPIKAKLKSGIELLTAIKHIYPTPAICGFPEEKALETIEELELFDRGMYSGVIGWFNNEGSGDFAVAIRSALLNNKTLYAFAGCGIVNGSDSINEFKETELKFKPIISLFQNAKKDETINQP